MAHFIICQIICSYNSHFVQPHVVCPTHAHHMSTSDFGSVSLCLLKQVFGDICCEIKVELRWQNRAASTNARVMTTFDLSKSTLNYLICQTSSWIAPLQDCRHRNIDPYQREQKQTTYKFICTPKRAAMTPIDMSKIIFVPLITFYLIADISEWAYTN